MYEYLNTLFVCNLLDAKHFALWITGYMFYSFVQYDPSQMRMRVAALARVPTLIDSCSRLSEEKE
jgi:hypothetical protein